jgi:TnpA family transposase
LFYTHLSDQYAPFYTKVINANVRDATHVLDGLLYHESQLRIEEHYTDTAGFTDHVFALFHPLGFEFAPRISDLADKRIYIPGKAADWSALAPLVGGSLNTKLMEQQFDEFMRLVASIKQGAVTASLILRKLASYPRQNSLALAVREFGRLERTLFMLRYIRDPAIRHRISAGLAKGESRNSLARAIFFHRLGEIRDRSYENQLSGQRPESRRRRDHNVEYRVPGAGCDGSHAAQPDRRIPASPRLAARMEPHRIDRGLQLARQ